MGWIIFPMIGVHVIELGWKRRVGDSRHCARCDYEKNPDSVEADRCPECGAAWRLPGGTVRGRPVRNPWLIGIGTAVTGVGVFLLTGQFGWGLDLYPTRLLVHQVTNNPGFTVVEWAELNTRTLSRSQELDLARKLLGRRVRTGHLSQDAENWLTGLIAAGSLPADLLERWYDEMSEVWIVAPTRAAVGDSVTLAIGLTDREPLWLNESMSYFVGGFVVEASGEPKGRLEKPRERFSLAAERRMAGSTKTATDAPRVTIEMTRPGAAQVKLLMWRVYGPHAIANQPIQWQADGTPVIPATAVWSEVLELEHVIRVEP